jgi:periplasmic divalent cation tolerance protein
VFDFCGLPLGGDSDSRHGGCQLSYGKRTARRNPAAYGNGIFVPEPTMPADALQVVTTTAEKKDAEALAQAALEARLAACVQISGPIESRYWWNGRLESAIEWTVTFKTRRTLFTALEALISEKHPYDEPEIVGTAIGEVSAGYLKWLREQVQDGAKGDS